MGVCDKGYIAVQFNPSTGKVLYNPATKKVQTTICGGCVKTVVGGESCCPDGAGSLPYYLNLCVLVSGIKFCADDEIITELENQVYCVDMEDPCEYHCSHGNYYFYVNVTGGNLVVWIKGYALGRITADIFFSATIACPGALPVTIPNGLAIGDCGGNNKGYDGQVKIN